MTDSRNGQRTERTRNTSREASSPRKTPRRRSGADLDASVEVKGAAAGGAVSEALARSIGPRRYRMWFSQTKVAVTDNQVAVATDSRFVADWIGAHFRRELTAAATEAVGPEAQVEIRVAPELFDRGSGQDQRARSVDREPADRSVAPRPSHTTPRDRPVLAQSRRRRPPRRPVLHELDGFVVGAANRLSHSAALQLVDEADDRVVSPLFIHSETGLGKTHLLQGICARWMQRTNRPSRALYVTGEQFTNEYISAVRDGTLDAFRARYRKLELLAVDDVHFLANKVRTQSEFMHTFDALNMNGGRVALASSDHPRQIRRFSQALISRFMSGMVTDIQRPDRTMRMAIITQSARMRGITINAPAIELIADRCLGSIREIEGAVTKLAALSTLSPRSSDAKGAGKDAGPDAGSQKKSGGIGLVLAEQLFRDQGWQPAAPIRIKAVIESVCQRLGIERTDLLGTGRHRKVVLGRALVAYLSRELTTLSFPEIARALGRTYHSTVHTADQRLRRQMDDAETAELTEGEPAIDVKELVDQLRHAIVRGPNAA